MTRAHQAERRTWTICESITRASRPGFSCNPRLPEVLTGLGSRYDSSQLPACYAGPLRILPGACFRVAKWISHVTVAFAMAFTSLRPHRLDGAALLEAPVTTVPLFRVPMHSTFVLSAGR